MEKVGLLLEMQSAGFFMLNGSHPSCSLLYKARPTEPTETGQRQQN